MRVSAAGTIPCTAGDFGKLNVNDAVIVIDSEELRRPASTEAGLAEG